MRRFFWPSMFVLSGVAAMMLLWGGGRAYRERQAALPARPPEPDNVTLCRQHCEEKGTLRYSVQWNPARCTCHLGP